jgi:ABC-type phosphate/phosphonate transport system ATPase subunit
MQKRKLPRDANSLAAQIVSMSTGQPLPKLTESTAVSATFIKPTKEKNPAAVALGRLGGLKGGKARAEALTQKQRAEIAKLAAQARWKKSN